jgi:mono/diheme cytochrome c family protein
MKDGQLFHILTYGQNSMPNFAAQLSPDRRWDVVNHLRSMQAAAHASDQPPDETAKPAADDASEPKSDSDGGEEPQP